MGDLDGDGEYEIIVKWDPSNAKDNSQGGYTGNVYLDAYKLDGTRLWRIDLGRNIRAGAHYTQFMVYDLDGDGKAEVACKTADGTVDGAGTVIGDPARRLAQHRRATSWPARSSSPSSTARPAPRWPPPATSSPRGTVSDWGDNYGNRVDRFLAARRLPRRPAAEPRHGPRLLHAHGARGLELARRPAHATSGPSTPATPARRTPTPPIAARATTTSASATWTATARTRSCTAPCAIDDDGTGLYTTGFGHGDALHMSDMDPDRPGLEVFQPHESPSSYGPNALELRDAAHRRADLRRAGHGRRRPRRGARHRPALPRLRDVGLGRRPAACTPPSSRRRTRSSVRAASRSRPTKPSINFGVWWDGDPLRELLDGTTISKWDWLAGNTDAAARARGRLLEQRHQGHARPQRRHPGRLARGGDLARVRQHRAAHLHHHHPHRRTGSTR